MRILYVALDQVVPGTVGGSVHVQAVADGLARLGHEVHVATTPGGTWPAGHVHWHALSPPMKKKMLRWMRAGAVEQLARETHADVIIERYYNFGGEGVLAAERLRVPAVLEVNAPIIDYSGSPKARLDRLLFLRPLERWRTRLSRSAALFVTPDARILPPWIDRRRVLEIEWGADTDRFRPDVTGPIAFERDSSLATAVFAGAFRVWHGAVHLASSLARLHAAGDHRFGGVFIGDGPEHASTMRAAAGVAGVVFTGALPHDQLPANLAAADIGVAPFDPSRHDALRLGFYWSPLKIFEYMAAGLPVVAPAIPRLQSLVEHGREGILYDAARPNALDAALITLADRNVRRQFGAAARARAVRDYSWRRHCEELDARLRTLI